MDDDGVVNRLAGREAVGSVDLDSESGRGAARAGHRVRVLVARDDERRQQDRRDGTPAEEDESHGDNSHVLLNAARHTIGPGRLSRRQREPVVSATLSNSFRWEIVDWKYFESRAPDREGAI